MSTRMPKRNKQYKKSLHPCSPRHGGDVAHPGSLENRDGPNAKATVPQERADGLLSSRGRRFLPEILVPQRPPGLSTVGPIAAGKTRVGERLQLAFVVPANNVANKTGEMNVVGIFV